MAEKAAVVVELEQISVTETNLSMALLVKLNCAMPAQGPNLLYEMEMVTQEAGRVFMRHYYRLLLEKADAELVLSMRNKGIQRIGRIPYTIKTEAFRRRSKV